MSDQKPYSVLLRLLLCAFGACWGWLFYVGAAWIVYHDSINYRLPHMLSLAAETARAIGPIIWIVVGLLLAMPLLLGCVRQVASFGRLVALHALIYVLLVCGFGSGSGLLRLGLFVVALLVWIGAVVMAAVCPPHLAQQDNVRPALG